MINLIKLSLILEKITREWSEIRLMFTVLFLWIFDICLIENIIFFVQIVWHCFQHTYTDKYIYHNLCKITSRMRYVSRSCASCDSAFECYWNFRGKIERWSGRAISSLPLVSLNMQQLFPYLWKHVAFPCRFVTPWNGPYLALRPREEGLCESSEFSVRKLTRRDGATGVTLHFVRYGRIIIVYSLEKWLLRFIVSSIVRIPRIYLSASFNKLRNHRRLTGFYSFRDCELDVSWYYYNCIIVQ